MNKKLKTMINQSSIISFDILELIGLKDYKTKLNFFKLIEKCYNSKHNSKIENFAVNRLEIEKELKKRKDIIPITIDDIYKTLKKQYQDYNPESLKKLEIDLLTELCYLPPKFDEILKYCYKNNKQIIIISDSYLDKTTLNKLLKKLKITYSNLFYVNELEDFKSNNKILHIGYKLFSDFIFPKLHGFNSFLYFKKMIIKKNMYPKNKITLLNYFINQKLKELNQDDSYLIFGYQNLGPLMYGFCEYLKNNLKKDNNLIFLSREGKFINQCFNHFCNKEDNYNNKYMYISRKSIATAVIEEFDSFEKFISSQSIAQNETVNLFLKRINLLDNKEVLNFLSKENINLNDSFYQKNVQKFFQENFNMLKKHNEKNNKNLKEYLKEFNINNKTILIDIGWNGTMQDLLSSLFKKESIDFKGYYLGVRKNKKTELKHGYLFDGDNEVIELQTRSMIGFLEILFSANHGSTIYYDKNNKGKIEPVLIKNDISDDILDKVKKIQLGAIKFINDFKNSNFKELCKLTKDEYSYNILKIGLNPTLEEINLFDDFKVYDEKQTLLIGNPNLLHYIVHPKQFINDYIESSWKNAFLKKIFKINLPYFKIFKFAQRRKR